MKKHTYTFFLFFFTPLIALAQTTGLQSFFKNILTFISSTFIPFLLGIAFLFFIINIVRYFVFETDSSDGQEKAKSLAIYGIAAFVLLTVFWGIVNMLSASTGFDNTPATSDYVSEKGSSPRSTETTYSDDGYSLPLDLVTDDD